MAKLNASGRDLLEQMRAAIEAEYADEEADETGRKWDPLIEMAVYAANRSLSPAMRFAANREIAQYVYAKRKAIELDPSSDLRVLLVQFSDKGFIIDQSAERIEDQNGNGTRVENAKPALLQPPVDAPEQSQLDQNGRLAPGQGDDDLRGDRNIQ